MKKLTLLFSLIFSTNFIYAEIFSPKNLSISTTREKWYKTKPNGELNHNKFIGAYYYLFYKEGGKESKILRIKAHLYSAVSRKITSAKANHKLIQICLKKSDVSDIEDLENIKAIRDIRDTRENILNNLLELNPEANTLVLKETTLVETFRKRKVWTVFYREKASDSLNPEDEGKNLSPGSFDIPLCYIKPKALSLLLNIRKALHIQKKKVYFNSDFLKPNKLLDTKHFKNTFKVENSY